MIEYKLVYNIDITVPLNEQISGCGKINQIETCTRRIMLNEIDESKSIIEQLDPETAQRLYKVGRDNNVSRMVLQMDITATKEEYVVFKLKYEDELAKQVFDSFSPIS